MMIVVRFIRLRPNASAGSEQAPFRLFRRGSGR